MTKKTMTIVLAILVSLVATACNGTGAGDLDEATQTAVDELDTQISEVGDQLEAADIDATIEENWTALESELAAAVDDIQAGETIDTNIIDEQIAEFESSLENADVDIGAEFQEAWDNLTASFDALTAATG